MYNGEWYRKNNKFMWKWLFIIHGQRIHQIVKKIVVKVVDIKKLFSLIGYYKLSHHLNFKVHLEDSKSKCVLKKWPPDMLM